MGGRTTRYIVIGVFVMGAFFLCHITFFYAAHSYPWPCSIDDKKYLELVLEIDKVKTALAQSDLRRNNDNDRKLEEYGDELLTTIPSFIKNDADVVDPVTTTTSAEINTTIDPLSKSRIDDGTSPTNRHIFYLHVPKAGTSFFNTVYLHFCPRVAREHPGLLKQSGKSLIVLEKKYGYDDACYDDKTKTQTIFYNQHRNPVFHWALDLDPNLPNTVVAIFRDPYLRAKSGFMYTAHYDLRPMMGEDPNITFQEYVNMPKMKNCQVAMLTSNKECYALNKNNPNITKAKELIRQPNFFFGITERWDETICLFHKRFGGEVQPFELRNNRKTTQNSRYKVYHHMLDNVTRDMMPKDLDTIFFEDAVKVFDQRLKDAGCYGWSAKSAWGKS